MSKMQHGTTSMYTGRDCRCSECRAAMAEYQRNYRAQKTNTGTPACRICGRIGIPRPLKASVGPAFTIVGTMILCDRHRTPDVVETSWWEPGARMVPA